MEESLTDILRRGANEVWGLGLTEGQIAQFARYAELLTEWNATRMNLTRLTAPRDVAVKHFLDSLALLTVVPIPQNARLLDVGTGAGLPGLALKIARPDLRVTLLDSTAKKLTFCQAVADDLGLQGIGTLHARAGEGRGPLQLFWWPVDIVTARAVAPLERLLPLMERYIVPTGRLIALKGAGVAEEMETARPIARRLGLRLDEPIAVALPEADEPTVRQIVIARRKDS